MRQPVSLSKALPRLDHQVYGPSISPWNRRPTSTQPSPVPVDPSTPVTCSPAVAEEAVEVRPLAREEARLLHVALPVADVELAVPDIQVAHDHGERRRRPRAAASAPPSHRGRPTWHPAAGCSASPVWHVGAHDGEALAVDLEVGLDPAAGRVERARRRAPGAPRPAARGWRSRRPPGPSRGPRRSRSPSRGAPRAARLRRRAPPAARGCRHPPHPARRACPCGRRRGCR